MRIQKINTVNFRQTELEKGKAEFEALSKKEQFKLRLQDDLRVQFNRIRHPWGISHIPEPETALGKYVALKGRISRAVSETLKKMIGHSK